MKRVLFVLAFIFLCLSVINCFAVEDLSGQQFEGFNLQGYTDDGEKEWDVKGSTADVEGNNIKISNVDANSYGESKMNVTAETGYVNQTEGTMRLETDVVITGEEGSQLLTDSLDWDKKADLVTTNDDVVITDDRMTIMGSGMEAKPGLKTAKIQKDVTARINTDPEEEDSKIVTISSDGPMEVDHANAFATFRDNVVVVYDGQTLEADYMEAHFDNEMQGIKEIVCLGNVVITRGENRSVADEAIYNAKTQKLTLLGRPKMIFLTEETNAFTSAGD